MTDQTERLEEHFKRFDAFAAIDLNDNGRIDFGEFSSWWQKR